MASIMDRASVIKLNSSNYHLWKFGAEMLLLKEDLWDTVYNAPITPVDEKWTRKDNSARATIALSVDANLHHLISSCASSYDMWNKIKGHFEHASYSSRIFLKRKMYATKLINNEMDKFINDITGMVERLRLAGEIINDKEVISTLLCGLSDDYDGLIMAIEMKEESKVSLEEVKIVLRDEARRKEEKISVSEQHVLVSSYGRPNRYNSRPDRICYECKRPGHIRFQCPSLRREIETKKEVVNSAQAIEKSEVSENFCSYLSLATRGEIYDKNSVWVVDSGANVHMCNDFKLISNYKTFDVRQCVKFADGSLNLAVGKGDIECDWNNDDKVIKLNLQNVVFVPELITNLLSVSQLCDQGFTVIFGKECVIQKKDLTLTTDVHNEGVYIMKFNEKSNSVMTACLHEWHRRMGHRNLADIKKLCSSSEVKGLKVKHCNHGDYCKTCANSKICQKPYTNKTERQSDRPFFMIHSDVCGPVSPRSRGGGNYYIALIDDYSRYCVLKVMCFKSEATGIIKDYINHFCNYFGRIPAYFRSDGGGEYENRELNEFLTSKGIKHQLSLAYSPEQNGTSERINRTLIDMIKSTLLDNNMNRDLWGEIAAASCYLYNRSIHSSTSTTPFKLWTGKSPNVSHLRVIGSRVVYYVPKQLRTKLENNGRDGTLIGYGDRSKGYKILDGKTDKIVYSRSVSFDETARNEKAIENPMPEVLIIELPEKYCKEEENQKAEFKPRRSDRENLGKIPARYLD